jgi:hypothetical protein
MRSPAGQFTASACNFVDWDNGGVGSPAILLEAGKAIIQGCTFNRNKLHVTAGAGIGSAILTGNQAEGGFRLKNLAGARVQAALNEQDGIVWTKEARQNYEIQIGAKGDGRYLESWFEGENVYRPFRWSTARSRLLLPASKGRRYTLRLEAHVPPQAVSPEAGLYLRGKKIASLKSGSPLVAELPPAAGDTIELELRCAAWVPQLVIPGSNDPRALGVQGFRLNMQSGKPGRRLFGANSGEWRNVPQARQ